MDDNVLISVDPHKASATVAVLDPMTRTPLEGARFANTAEGYLELRRFARRWRRRSWAIEGCRGAGRSLAQRLVADGERVVDVPAKPAAVRPSGRAGGPAHPGHLPPAPSARRAHPRGRPSRADRRQGGRGAARLRPQDEPGRIRRQVAMDHLGDVRSLDRRIKQLEVQLQQSVSATGTTLLGLFGVGPVIAARLLAEVGDVSRFPTKDHCVLRRPDPSPPTTAPPRVTGAREPVTTMWREWLIRRWP